MAGAAEVKAVPASHGMKKNHPTLARFLRHSVQALGVTTPRPRRLLLAWALAASCEVAAGEGAGCFSEVAEGGSGLFEDWAERLRESSSIATIYKGWPVTYEVMLNDVAQAS